ncbi:DUF2167 domain-containing protein [Opitutus sp. GAS368]|jgi:uncharacterized membrane-anchored protein|uniref:DUF2167 domain-containing protein n=1 Tax=Opitutus sp. GAS368 TaxID=1882749 RepID=UPI00087AE771|nr:DUF2167 domain-containing protein [Opitutus sp. GAS368]SDS56980.1 Uncharacterized membrane-anchored protein [Opitutus sp. GAS368]
MRNLRLVPALLGLFAANALFAADAPPPDPAAAAEKAGKLAATLKYEKGVITLRDGLARISLPENYRYLNPADTETLLTKLWGNPGGGATLGMIVPAGFDPLGGADWAVVLSFSDDGYVKDDDAAKIDYADLLKKMKEDTTGANKERTEAGYPPIELIGWAAPPRYDASTHKLYWAKEIKFGDEKEHTLNYNIRMLGRRGVLVLNVVAVMPQLKVVEAATPALLAMVDFQEGHRYADFNTSTDKVATYGLAALVAGGLAAKAGFFKLLWVGILAFKKVILLALVAAASSLKKLWNWMRGRKAEEAAAPTPPPPASA